jgi:glucose-6-phosphate isomerase
MADRDVELWRRLMTSAAAPKRYGFSFVTREMEAMVSDQLLEKFQEAYQKKLVRRLNIEYVKLTTGDIHSPTQLNVRKIGDMAGYFQDERAYRALDPNVMMYKYAPCEFDTLSYVVTELLPGAVGDEYFMTKGHFHATIERPGIYTTFTGFGVLILQPKDENAPVMFSPMEKGTLCYIPPYTGHRVANIGNEKIIYTGTTTTDAGWSYGVIKEKGFKYLIVKSDRKADIIPNPKWES